MFIHTTEKGETLYSIARKYGVPATMIIQNNALKSPDRLCVGQKLVILTPTRTYTVRGGDTTERIARRFGISERSLIRSNPALAKRKNTYPEQVLALKYDTPQHGCAILNGYYYRGCSDERLSLALTHAEYITVSAYKSSQGALERVMRDDEIVAEIKRHRCVPLMRIYDGRKGGEILAGIEKYTDAIISAAKRGGYSGITLAAIRAARDVEFREVLFLLKKKAIGEGLSVLCEISGDEGDLTDICDGCVLTYEKCAMKEIPTFDDGERKFYTNFSERCESIKCFMDIPSFAYAGGECLLIHDANELAYRAQREIEYDPDKMICRFEYTKYARGNRTPVQVVYEAPENIKAKLALAAELGFMGMSFDIMRIPTEYLMMIASSFAPGANYSLSSFDI